jgi:hypothetical protein
VRFFVLAVLPLVLASAPGCVLTDIFRESARQTKRISTPNPVDYRDETEEPGDPWAYVGEDARGNQPRELDPDPWWKRWVMSEKARSIERNLGYD